MPAAAVGQAGPFLSAAPESVSVCPDPSEITRSNARPASDPLAGPAAPPLSVNDAWENAPSGPIENCRVPSKVVDVEGPPAVSPCTVNEQVVCASVSGAMAEKAAATPDAPVIRSASRRESRRARFRVQLSKRLESKPCRLRWVECSDGRNQVFRVQMPLVQEPLAWM